MMSLLKSLRQVPSSSLAVRIDGEAVHPPRGDRADAAVEVNDRVVRLIGVPAFAIAISHGAGLYGALRPADPVYWLGLLFFLQLSWLIWQGNRYFLLRQRAHLNWFEQPGRKLMALLAVSVLYTAPLTAAWLWSWFFYTGRVEESVPVILAVSVVNVVCVIFVTHAYETIYLIKQRADDRLQVERLERTRAEAELEALKSQIDPHFLFNSLNTLAQLVETRPADARAFCGDLAEIYRYILRHKNEPLVPLATELSFCRRYCALLERRFGKALEIVIIASPHDRFLIPPISVQVLIENAVKHNAFSEDDPLIIRIGTSEQFLSVENDWRPLKTPAVSSGLGLKNLNERNQLLTRRNMEVVRDGGSFRVAIPLIERVPV